MKIKSVHKSSILKNLYLLVGLMFGLILIAVLVNRSQPKKDASEQLPTSAVDFMKKETSLLELLQFFSDHTILLSVKDDASTKFGKGLREKIADLGGTQLAEIGLRESYVGVFQGGKFIEEKRSNIDSLSLDFSTGTIQSGGRNAGNFSACTLGDKTWNEKRRGLNVFVIGHSGALLGTWNFDFYEQENPLARTERYVPAFFNQLDVIELELKEKHFAKLKKKRDEAMETKLLLSEEEDWVAAKVNFHDAEMTADIRLKGDWVDHLEGDNWSFRVKLDSEHALMGMRKFSLHRPETRNYAGEWLFHAMLRDADILNLQYHFVQVKLKIISADGGISERLLGLYALEEFFDKHLLERNNRREGVILKVDEAPIWEERAAFYAQNIPLQNIAASSIVNYENLPVLPFGQSRIIKDSSLLKQFNAGAELFHGFLTGKRLIHEVFDVERLAKFAAICNLLGADHALVPHNIRVYYNPITSRLEPIGFDGNAWTSNGYIVPYFRTIDDPIFHAAYLGALEEIISDAYFEKIVNWPGLNEQLELMSLAYPELEQSFKTLNANRGTIRNSIFPPRMLKVNFEQISEGYLHLTVENFGRFPVEIIGVTNTNGREFGRPSKKPFVLQKDRMSVALKLDKNFNRLFTRKGKNKSGFDAETDLQSLHLTYKTLGTSALKSEKVFPWTASANELAEQTPSQKKPNAHQFDFLVFDEIEKTITAKPGLCRLESPLIIPPGYTFQAGPGTRFELMNYYGKIISYSALKFVGTADSPVEIFSKTRKGLGLCVLNTPDTSHFEHCQFRNLSNPETRGWSLSGAVNFYEAPVSLEHCLFSENRCEDALNIFRSWFSMKNVVFTDIHADAFDGDFVEGLVQNCQFTKIGNDAIDVSGSDILVENVVISEAGDKGLSAGENSRLTARNVVIKNSAIAIASKDLSILKISHSSLKTNDLTFTSFQKKPEFGPAKIEADSVSLSENVTEFLIETNSSLLLNGQFVPTVDGVIERMYGEEFGRKSER